MFKEIHWDHVITEFGYKDDALHIHFRPGKKFAGKFDVLDSKLDTHIKEEFRKEIRPTGKIIEETITPIKDVRYSAKFNEPILWNKPSLYQKIGLPNEKPVEFEQANNLYKELLNLYNEKDVIHKTYTKSLLDSKWDEAVCGYIVYHKTPFIDDIMLSFCEKLERSFQ